MSANVDNIQVEPCRASWPRGTDLGFTDGDIEIKIDEKAVDITAHQEGSNVLDAIRTGKHVEIALTFLETTPAQLRALLLNGGGASNDVAQIASLTCTADTASSLHGKVFYLVAQDGTKYLFQLKSALISLVAPVVTGWTTVQVSYTADDNANTIADLVAAQIDSLGGFVAPNPAAAVIAVTWADGGEVPSGSGAGNTPFTFTVGTAGSSALTGWGNSKDFSGMKADSDELVLHPVTKGDTDLSADMNFWLAYPMLGSIHQSGEKPKSVKCSFKIFPDSSKPDAIRLFAYGDGS